MSAKILKVSQSFNTYMIEDMEGELLEGFISARDCIMISHSQGLLDIDNVQ